MMGWLAGSRSFCLWWGPALVVRRRTMGRLMRRATVARKRMPVAATSTMMRTLPAANLLRAVPGWRVMAAADRMMHRGVGAPGATPQRAAPRQVVRQREAMLRPGARRPQAETQQGWVSAPVKW